MEGWSFLSILKSQVMFLLCSEGVTTTVQRSRKWEYNLTYWKGWFCSSTSTPILHELEFKQYVSAAACVLKQSLSLNEID